MVYAAGYVGHYRALAEWLRESGHAVYPYEMSCRAVAVKSRTPLYYNEGKPVGNVWHELYGLVDVVSFLDGKLYAWEYKSQRDSLKRGFLQVQNYARSFDFVCLASVLMPTSPLLEKFEDMGAGLYAETSDESFRLVNEPKQQKPNETWRNELLIRFGRVTFPYGYAKCKRQLKQIDSIAISVQEIVKDIRKQERSQQQLLATYSD